MLPAPVGSSDFPVSLSAKCGIHAMELLMNDLKKCGVRRTDIRAKVVASDVGGIEPRKIIFYARGREVLLKRIGGTLVNLAEKDEERYL
jgi:chemotaxis receptor (MCP) glutamine deamidase CheD